MEDRALIQRVRLLADQIMDGPGLLRDDWIADNHWCVVPVETAKHFNHLDCERIAYAAAAHRCEVAYAILAEPLANVPDINIVAMTPRGLADFSQAYGSCAYTLIPAKGEFAVACHSTSYFLVAGTGSFVQSALGDIETAITRFASYINEELPEYRPWLTGVLQRYRASI